MGRFQRPPPPALAATTTEPAPLTVPPVLLAPRPRPRDLLTTAEVPNYTYLGCYEDSSSPSRALQGANNKGDGLNPASCCSWCSQQNTNYNLCGVEFGSECWCDSALAYTPLSVDNCDSACVANEEYQCGGLWAFGLYSSTVTPTAQEVRGYSNLGCYTDYSNDGRILLGTQTVFAELDARICCNWCSTAQENHRYCGVEVGNQCRCDSTTKVGAVAAEPTECGMPCIARANDQCGSIWRMNLYEATETEKSPMPAIPTTATTFRTSTAATATATKHPSGGGKAKYSVSDKIALGVGIGIGMPTLLVAVWMCWCRR